MHVKLDKNLEDIQTQFDALIVAPFFASDQDAMAFIDKHLRNDGLGCLAIKEHATQFQQLFQILKSEDKSKFIPLMQVACEPMWNENNHMQSVDLERWLQDWKEKFEIEKGKRPYAKDIREDAKAFEIFKKYSQTRKYDPRL